MSVESNLWYPPAVPHEWDDEFNSSVIHPRYEFFGAGSSLVPDLVTSPSFTAELDWPDVRISANQRRSWLRIQAGAHASNIAVMLYAPDPGVILPNGFYWTRQAPSWHLPAVNGAGTCLFGLFSSQETYPERDSVQVGIELDTDAVQRSFLEYQNQSATATENEESGDLETRGEPHEYVGIMKVGNVHTAWSANAAGQWMRFFEATYAGSGVIDSFGFRSGSTSKSNGSEVQSWDFIRYSPSTTILP